MLEQATSSAKPPPGKPKGWDPNPNSLLEQLECHAYIVSVVDPSKASWNLDSWRPAVPWWIEVFDFCNPPASGFPVLPSVGLSPSSIDPLPLLPPSPYQPLLPLPTVGGTGHAETTGGVTHTWTNYTNAGGTQGPSIPSNATVEITCAIQGFRVADGNTWWYKIASIPWNDAYYASADAFYNNGATTGSLVGTPFVDPSVPTCTGASIARARTPRSRGTKAYRSKLSVTKRSGSILLKGASRAKIALVELDLSATKCMSFTKMRNKRTTFAEFYVRRSRRFALSLPSQALRTHRNTHLCAFLLTTHGKHAAVRAST